MRKTKAIGFIVVNEVYPVALELCGKNGYRRITKKSKTDEKKTSTLLYGTVGTIFKSKKAALAAVERTKVKSAEYKSVFHGNPFTVYPVAF